MKPPYIVGISGGSGSGKTCFAKKLQSEFASGQVEIFSLDNYYKPIALQPLDDEGNANFDLPESFFREKMHRDLTLLRRGESIEIPKYEFNINRGGEHPNIKVFSRPVILMEGLFAYVFEEIQPLIDLKIFMESPAWLMMKRRIMRDEMERGYGNLQETLERYEKHAVPAFEQYILPTKRTADLVIPNYQNFDNAVKAVASCLKPFVS